MTDTTPAARELAAELTASGTLEYPASPTPERCDVHGGRSLTACDHGPTPVADALTEVNYWQAKRVIVSHPSGEGELAALRKLADAVRSHGIGAELGQLRQARAFVPPF
jgi:hypothetical protein